MKDASAMRECRIWTGATNGVGYGRRWMHGRIGYVHRQAYEMAYGPIPPGVLVLHRCDNPACYEPTHLFTGTHRDNMADMVAKGRGRNHGGFPGERNPAAKLRRTDVDAIRAIYASGGISQEAVGRQFGIAQSQVSAIVSGRSWSRRA